MRVMVIVKANKDSEAGSLPNEKVLADMQKFNEELVKAGVMLAGEGLHPSSRGKRVKFTGGKRTVIDGPLTETKELIAGVWLWPVEAIEGLARSPFGRGAAGMGDDAVLEIRPVHETDDFAESDPSGKLRQKWDELRQTVQSQRSRS